MIHAVRNNTANTDLTKPNFLYDTNYAAENEKLKFMIVIKLKSSV